MSKAGAVAGMISAVAVASVSQNVAYADGPFNLASFRSSQHSAPPVNVPQAASAAAASAPDGEEKEEKRSHAKNDNPRTSSAGFNPEPLERGVELMKEISQAKDPKKVFELIKEREKRKQIEQKRQIEEAKAIQSQAETERQKVIYEAQKKLAQHQQEIKKQMMQYEDELARKRMQFENEMARHRNQELVKWQEDSARQLDAERKNTEEAIMSKNLEYERMKAEIEAANHKQRAMFEADGKIKIAKETEDISRRAIIDKANAEREKWVAAINTTFGHIGGGLKAILTDQNKLIVVVGGVTALAAGVYTSREGAKVVWSYVDRVLGQPSLIRESSRGKYPWSGLFRRGLSTLSRDASKAAGQNGFGDVVLHPSLQKRIQQLANATANTKAHQAPFRNMLFYGPPGTGKTMAAREMAKKSGLDYALMTGGDVAPLGSQAVTKIHQLFDWAKKSNRGLLLFIDEADAFLCERNKTYMSEAQRSALNALLFRTGDQSKDIVLALATNRPGDLDSAVADRIDEVLEFPLPGEEERFKLLKLYLNKYIAQAGARKPGLFSKLFKKEQQKIEIKGITDEMLQEAAARTEGFSGREIAKLMASVQAACYGSEDCVLDANLFREVIDYKVAEHQQRRKLTGTDGSKTEAKI